MLRALALIASLILAAPGAGLALLSCRFGWWVLTGIISGTFTRRNYMEVGCVHISRTREPDNYWSNIGFWSFLVLVLAIGALLLLTPLIVTFNWRRWGEDQEATS